MRTDTTLPGGASRSTLCAWAGERVAEPAAAPKAVTVLDAIPVTEVGKPYKLPLRADATRRAVLDALRGIDAHLTVDTRIEDGDPVVAVTVAPGTDVGAVGALLGRYAITWELAVAAPTAMTSTKE